MRKGWWNCRTVLTKLLTHSTRISRRCFTEMPVSSRLLAKSCGVAGMVSLPVTKEHAIAVAGLRRAENTPPHNDPFDSYRYGQIAAEPLERD